MKIGFMTHSKFQDFMDRILKGYDCYAPQDNTFEKSHLKRLIDTSKINLFGLRTEEPVTSLFFPPSSDLSVLPEEITPPKALIGIKGCDLSAMKLLDWVFMNGSYVDPFYYMRRNNTLIISTDCVDFNDSCFCTLIGEKSYPESGFDINISQINDGFLLEAGTEIGEELLIKNNIFEATPNQIEERLIGREDVKNTQLRNLEEKGFNFNYLSLDYVVKNSSKSPIWDNESEKCVECGACTFVCPTCHCFLLSSSGRSYFSKHRNWDSCLYYGFARVAGGANPRYKLRDRLRNRFVKKFVFFPEVLDRIGCTGCGRCIDACLGKIDIRKVLEEVSSEKSVSI